MSFGVNNFRNTEAMRLIYFYFSKCSKFNVDSKNAIKIDKKFLIFQIIAFELVAVNSLYCYENACRWQSTCELVPPV